MQKLRCLPRLKLLYEQQEVHLQMNPNNISTTHVRCSGRGCAAEALPHVHADPVSLQQLALRWVREFALPPPQRVTLQLPTSLLHCSLLSQVSTSCCLVCLCTCGDGTAKFVTAQLAPQ